MLVDFNEAMARKAASDQTAAQRRNEGLRDVAQAVTAMQKEFERHALDMIAYLNENGIRAKRPRKLTMPAGYIIEDWKAGKFDRGSCTILLPDIRLITLSRTTGKQTKGRLFERQGYKLGDTDARDRFGQYDFSAGPTGSYVQSSGGYGDGTPCELVDAFVDYAQRIIENHT